jgi:tetratricopeptide (TPR) repeat protein
MLDDKKVATLNDAVKEFGANLGLAVSLKQDGQLVRASYSLIDTKSDRNLAADSLTAPVSDMFAIEDKLTSSIANALHISLRTEEKQALGAHATTIPEAYQYFLEGQGYLQPQREALTSAETLFQQALKLDPNYGPAEAGLGQPYWSLYDLTKQEHWTDAAQKHCAKAIELGNAPRGGAHLPGTIQNGTGKYEKAVGAIPAEQFGG